MLIAVPGISCALTIDPADRASESTTELYTSLDVRGYSESVPVADMVQGWDGPFQSGRYALGDVRLVTGARWQSWFVERESRWHYDLRFSSGMSRYYYALEQGRALASTEALQLDVRSVEAWGVRLGRAIEHTAASGKWRLTPALAVYRAGHFQYGQLSGTAEQGSDSQASAELEYHYDDDKILEHDPFVPKGWGVSLDITAAWQGEHWQADVRIQDAINRWQWNDAAFTTACININDPQQSICTSSGTASGRSGQDVLVARLRPTTSARLVQSQWQTEASLDLHDRFERLGLHQFFLQGQAGVSVHTTRQLGVHWRSGWLTLDWLSDDLRLSYARDLDIRARVNLQW